MAGETKILFADTNVFIQVRDLKDIRWRDLFPGIQTVDVMVASRVIEELDKYKISTNQRLRNRARLALNLIDKASLEPDHALVLKEKSVRVRIVISTAPRFDWGAHPNLDPVKPDDQLVAEALSFGNGLEVFSHDSGPRIRARIAGMKAYEPLADWLLPVEQTDDQRKITKLERDLELALSRSPRIDAGFDNIDEATSEIRVIRPVLSPLHPELVHQLVTAYLLCHPPAELISSNNRLLVQLGGVSGDEARRYDARYLSFQEKVREYYASFHERVRRIGMAAAIAYFVRNDSGVAAEDLRIEFDLEGTGSLIADREDATPQIGSFEMPKPPEAPRSWLSPNLGVLTVPHTFQDIMQPRDPVAFYWVQRPSVVAYHSACQCPNFRATCEFHASILVLTWDDVPVELGLRLHVSAANFPAPINVAARLIISEQAAEWSDPVVQAILPEYIAKLL